MFFRPRPQPRARVGQGDLSTISPYVWAVSESAVSAAVATGILLLRGWVPDWGVIVYYYR